MPAIGLWAWVIQHELDHLNGVLICDRGDSSWQDRRWRSTINTASSGKRSGERAKSPMMVAKVTRRFFIETIPFRDGSSRGGVAKARRRDCPGHTCRGRCARQ
ncbi:MAG: peptide deformylase [Verrucomicrobia bacterium]|nr:peptide deformylase [Verrucomicrobiota bacterium]